MVFWSWARELEDSFDDSNAEKLSRIITRRALDEKAPLRKSAVNETEAVSNDDLHLSHSIDADAEDELSTQRSEHDIPPLYLQRATGESTVLARIPVMAIFHRNDAANRGVPHSFVSFLQRYPALPEIVVSSRLLGGRQQLSDQHSDFPLYTDCWRPSRARGGPLHRQQGSLAPRILRRDIAVSCTNIAAESRSRQADDRSVGYLDSRTPSLPALLPYLTSIEARGSASPAPVIDALTAAAHHATHFIPSYTVISRRSGWVPWVWVRRILIEEIYGRARVIFPDYVAAPDAMQDEWVVRPYIC
jgi:KUP system potassium uptake protein